MKFEIIHARSLVLAIAADALAASLDGDLGVPDYTQLDEGDLVGLSVREGGFERRPPMRTPNFKEARQTVLRILREDYEAGRLAFEQLLNRYQYVEATAQELAWHRWSEANGVVDTLPLADDEYESEAGNYFEDGRQWVPVREDWEGYEDHGFRPLVPVGDVLGFGGVA